MAVQLIEMNVWRLVAAVVLPPIPAALAALPFWRKRISMYGAIAGTGVLFAGALLFFLLEGIEVSRAFHGCERAGVPCSVHPDQFTRFVVYGAIAMMQIMALFLVDLRLERVRRERDIDVKWQR